MPIIHRVDQALRMWEDACLVRELLSRAAMFIPDVNPVTLTGPIVHASEFREHVLESRDKDFDDNRFVGLACYADELKKVLGWSYGIPFMVYSWCKFSRRVFHVSQDLALMLDATKPGELRWKDIDLPFDSFVITMDLPIVNEHTGQGFDCIMVNAYKNPGLDGQMQSYITFLVLSSSLEERWLLSNKEKDRCRKLFRNNKWQELSDFVRAYEAVRGPVMGGLFTINLDKIAGELVSESAFNLSQKDPRTGGRVHDKELWPQSNEALRMVVGVCMYFDGLGSVSSHQSPWQKLPRSGQLDRNAISNPARICYLNLDYELLTLEEREVLGTDPEKRRAYREMGFHWRRKHKRRPPGQGHLPVPKSVKVKATRVRPDRQPDGAIAAGSRQVLVG